MNIIYTSVQNPPMCFIKHTACVLCWTMRLWAWKMLDESIICLYRCSGENMNRL